MTTSTKIRSAGRATSSVVTGTFKKLLFIIVGVALLASLLSTSLVILAYQISK